MNTAKECYDRFELVKYRTLTKPKNVLQTLGNRDASIKINAKCYKMTQSQEWLQIKRI